MSKWKVVRRCYNCGAILQSENPNGEGYVEPIILEKTPVSMPVFCYKCGTESQYNFGPKRLQASKDYLDMIRDARASDALIVYLVNLYSFESSFIPEVTELIRGLKIAVIANKRDLFPKKADDAHLREYVAHRFRVAGIQMKADDVTLVSSLNMAADISSIVNMYTEKRQGHDVYIIGATGAGKTHFINACLRGYKNKSRFAVQTAPYPGTKLRVMQIPLDNSSKIYDTPGTPIDNSILNILDNKNSNIAIPQEAISKRFYSLGVGDSLLLGGVAKIQLVEGKRTNVNAYFARPVTIRLVFNNSDKTLIKGIEKGALRPISEKVKTIDDFDIFDIAVDEEGSRDIGIEGFGWINFTGAKQTFRVYAPKGISIYTTRAKLL
ncbi:MAG: 50S ribosome-binding GTPase [Bacilli bacterium]|nr:50S ribosome-binding GTPase [Bacilli bacterium]